MKQNCVRMPEVLINMVEGVAQPSFGPIPAGYIRMPSSTEKGDVKVFDVEPKDDCKTCYSRGLVAVLQMEQDGGVKEGEAGKVMQGCPGAGCVQERIQTFVNAKKVQEWAHAAPPTPEAPKAALPRREKPVDDELVKAVKALSVNVTDLQTRREHDWMTAETTITEARANVDAATKARDKLLDDAKVSEGVAKTMRTDAEKLRQKAKEMDTESDQIMEIVGLLRKQAADGKAITTAEEVLAAATEKQQEGDKGWVRKLKDPKRRFKRLSAKLPDDVLKSLILKHIKPTTLTEITAAGEDDGSVDDPPEIDHVALDVRDDRLGV